MAEPGLHRRRGVVIAHESDRYLGYADDSDDEESQGKKETG